jgi:integrase
LEQIATLIEAARQDAEHGIYYAFPFLAGTRPTEQLRCCGKRSTSNGT